MQCASCGQHNPLAAKFCLECGRRLPAACAACGHALPDTAKFCVECGAAVVPAAGSQAPESYTPRHLAQRILASRAALEGERKPVTVLFCDVVRSTPLAEALGPDRMHALLNVFFERALAEIHRYEGTINQFLGDGFMALFGAPLAHEDHARRAVLAALGLRRALAEHPLEIEPGNAIPVDVRLGIHTGFVVVGAIGDNLRMDYTAVGDTTHLAARLQHLAEPGAILVSDATARLVRGYVALEACGTSEVRGVSSPVAVHRVIGVGSRRSALDSDGAHALTGFVGRDREMRAMRDLLAEVEGGRGQAVGLVGEPGVGKSRLLLELRRELADRRVSYFEGRCLSFGNAIPYVPVLDIVRDAMGISDVDTPERVSEAVTRALTSLEMHPDAAPLLLHLLGVKERTDALAALAPEAIKTRTFDLLRQMSLKASQRRPVVFAVEDLHWIDKTSEECFAMLVDSLAGARIMLVATYRPGYRPPWIDRSYATQLSLARLARADSLSVLRSVLPRVADDGALATLILDKAEGNPFFLEELARVVAQHPDDDRRVAVPDTVHGVLMARIDRLPETAKRVLQTAAVLGREFTARLLAAVWAGGPPAPHLAELTRQEFLYERSGADEPTYVFKHALTQEVAEATLLAARRRELNLRAAEGLTTLYPERVRELAPLLAHHYMEAGAWRLACEHATRAAESASAAYANREAVARYDQAVAAAGRAELPDAERMRLHGARAHVHDLLGDFDHARADLEAALSLADAVHDMRARARFLGMLGVLWGGHRDYSRGLDLARDAARAAEASGDRRTLAEALTQSALMLVNICRIRDSDADVQRALAIFEELGDAAGVARTLDILSAVEGIRGRARDAVRHGEDALQRYRALGNRPAEVTLMPTVGFWHVYAGDWARGQSLIRSAIDMSVALGARRDEAYARMMIGWTGYVFGRYGESAREAERALSIARELGHLEWTVAALSVLGSVRALCGDVSGARRLHEDMLSIARELGTGLWIAASLVALGEDSFAVGDVREAVRLLDEARVVGGDAMEFGMPAMLARAAVHLHEGEAEQALVVARAARAATDYAPFAIEASRLEAEATAALGDTDAAVARLRSLMHESDTIACASAGWRVRLALADVLERRGARDDAAGERAAALRALEKAAADLPDDLRAAFEASAVMRRARVPSG